MNGNGRKMKTVEDFYKEISDSKELQEELKNASEEMLEAFLKKHDCAASAEDFVNYMKSQKKPQAEGELSDDTAENVAGGRFLWWPDGSDWDYGVSEHAD